MTKSILLTPFQKFFNTESLSGILLLAATVVALVWVNSPFAESYQALWEYQLGFRTPFFALNKPLLLWINDGLMAVFFFLIGLEIKRELMIGELNSMKKIAFPLIGAIGGMIVPVIFYLALNDSPETMKGWGIPMATDIAFSLAVLKVLGKRVPLGLIIFLTAFAIVDDIGAVLVIALFYTGDIDVVLLLWAAGFLAILYFLTYKGFFSKYLGLIIGTVIWILFLKAGIHPTIAGILMAFSVPVRQKILTSEYLNELTAITDNLKKAKILDESILSKEQRDEINHLEELTKKYQSPLQKLEDSLHGWVAYFIIPIFALANAGVSFSGSNIDYHFVFVITISLVLGKSIGITGLVLLGKKLKLIDIPNDICTRHIIGVSFLAGIGFTMAIFIASLAFIGDPVHIDSAKIGILIGSFIAAVIGYIILRLNTNKPKISSEQ
ncbi:sodium/proton antiporter (NhaA family) [Balneicella halophila]|uniref:Na(+)/H(+) antiporter NhaA n=1 Tax=Balneicella halophila TaxID=1537566 RepID=A0A7L4URB4_BALHA|nr:Na+/H+ antiporter NhaA [Balneicella halophila]PVX52290.1 sodium/proton antiporter (NhaA family) [Balneicella halophila]